MNDQRYMAVSFRGKRTKSSDYSILTPETIDMLWLIGSAHHKLNIVDYDVLNIVNILCMLYSLENKLKLVIARTKFQLICNEHRITRKKNFKIKNIVFKRV